MLILLFFAFISGVITILSPCILPVLPVVLAGSVTGGKARPFGIVIGFIVSFTVFTLTLTAIVQALGIPQDVMRYVAVAVLIIFGLIMLVPWLKERFMILVSGLANIGSKLSSSEKNGSGKISNKSKGFWGGVPVGLSLGIVWTPCVGPIMASVLALALTQKVNGSAALITFFYSLGTSIPMLAVMLGGRELLKRIPWLSVNTEKMQKVFGVLMILVGVAIGAGWDRGFQTLVLKTFPSYGSGLTAIENNKIVINALKINEHDNSLNKAQSEIILPNIPGNSSSIFHGVSDTTLPDISLPDYGVAPEIIPGGTWINSPELTMQKLRGSVVIVDFWTYSCINCIRTLPYIRAWYEAYKDKGLVIIGIHTPEFEFEKKTGNVISAVRDLKVSWPVVQDNNYLNWNSYRNQYWPADYFIDNRGHVRYFHFGEGDYVGAEQVIQKLLKEKGAVLKNLVSKPMYDIEANTPETYLGYERGSGFASSPLPVKDKSAMYKPGHMKANGEWTLEGNWIISKEYIEPQDSGILEFSFNAHDAYLVITPVESNANIKVTVDGKISGDTADVKSGALTIDGSRLYHLAGFKEPEFHTLHLENHGKVRLFAFTFG